MEDNDEGWEEHIYEVTWAYPATWWEHFKHDVMPEWFTKYFPVQYTLRTEAKTIRVRKA